MFSGDAENCEILHRAKSSTEPQDEPPDQH